MPNKKTKQSVCKDIKQMLEDDSRFFGLLNKFCNNIMSFPCLQGQDGVFVEMFFSSRGSLMKIGTTLIATFGGLRAFLPPGLPDGDGYHDMILPCGLFQEIPSRGVA